MSRNLKRPSRDARRRKTTDDFVRVSRATIGLVHAYIIKVNTAILGGDLTGDARGQYAIDLQTDRLPDAGGATQVASGNYAVQIGALNTVSGDYGVRVGYGGAVSGLSGVGIGNNATVDGEAAVSIGLNAYAGAKNSIAIGGATVFTQGALGVGATAKLVNAEYVLNTGVAPIVKRAAGLAAEANWSRHLAGALSVFTSGLIDLTSTGLYTLALPAGCKIWLAALGIVAVSWDNVTVQPTVRFGATFDDTKYVADRITTQLTTAAKREHYLPETLSDFETSPNFTVVTGATATTMTARVYWVGLLLEDE